MTVQFWLLWTLSAISMAQVQIHYIAYMCVINVIWYFCYNVLKISLNFQSHWIQNSVKPMPFQDRVSFSRSGGKAVAAAAPSKLVVPQIPKVGTSNNKKGNPVKRPVSTRKPKIKPEENQPKVSQFFKLLVVLVYSSSDDFLPDLVVPKQKLHGRKDNVSISPNYSPKYSYSVRGCPFALSSPARVNPALSSPEMSLVRCPPRNNTNGFILLDSESD